MASKHSIIPVSIIIPTYNGALKLPRAIGGLALQTLLPHETIVVVDGSSDHTLHVLEGLSSDHPSLAIKIVVQANSGRAGAKNRGISESSSELLVFMDDDMEPVPSWLECHVNHHLQTSQSIASGSLLPPVFLENTDLAKYQAWLHQQWHPPVHSTEPFLLDIPYIHAGNFSATKAILSLLGNFREGLNDCEDRLLALLAMESSIPLYLIPSSQAVHHDTHCTTFSGMARRALEYERARCILVMNEPLYLRFAPFLPFRPSSFKAKIYKLLSNDLFLQAAELGLFKFLPARVRFSLYSAIITSFSRLGNSF